MNETLETLIALFVKRTLMFESLALVAGLLLETYLLKKNSKYSILVPVLFLIYPVLRTPVILLHDIPWFYKLVEFAMISAPFILTALCFVIVKLSMKKTASKKNKEIDKMKIQDL